MAGENAEVTEFLRGLEHPLKDGIQELRVAILASDDEITEHIKWNAPSFCFRGDDRVTFRLQPGNRLQLIRGTVTFQDLEDADAKLGAVAELVGRWMRATA